MGDRLTVSVLWAFTLASLALILVRLAWRYRRGQKFGKDDFWMAVSIAPLLMRLPISHITATFMTAYFNHAALREDRMSADEVHRRTIGAITVLPSRICYAGFLWCMKASILGWFEKVTGMEKPYATLIRIAYVSLIISFVGVVLSTFLECRPVYLYWQIWPDPGKCVVASIQLVTMGLLNISTDLYLMAIPLPLVFRARLPLIRKLQLALLFSVSLFMVSITIVRIPIIVRGGTTQKSRSFWASIEVLIACIVANAPVLNSFLHFLRHSSRQYQNQYRHDGNSRQRQQPHLGASPSSQRPRARMPVTGQDSFGSLTRNEGLTVIDTDNPVCEPVPSSIVSRQILSDQTGLEITSISAKGGGGDGRPERERSTSSTWSKDLTASFSSLNSSSPVGGMHQTPSPPPPAHTRPSPGYV